MTDARDRNFDDLVGHFQKNIYDTPKGRIRLAILLRDLRQTIPAITGNRPLRILDAGAGLGYMAGELTALGHEVVLNDISADILAQAEQHLHQRHPKTAFRLINCAVQELNQHLDEPFDLVLFHAVLEWLTEPRPALERLTRFVKPGGHLSLMFYNRHSLIYRHLLNANFKVLQQGEPRVGERLIPISPLEAETVKGWLGEMELELLHHSGVRVIHDYLSHADKQRVDFDALLAMEERYSLLSPYRDLARYQHFVIRAPR